MSKPRLIHYNDCRHYSFYRYDPPMSAQQIRQPVDEILGTDVDLLSYGLASGQTFLHDTKVGLRWGEQMPSHNHGVMWWRAYENARQAIAAGNDPLRVVDTVPCQRLCQLLTHAHRRNGFPYVGGNLGTLGKTFPGWEVLFNAWRLRKAWIPIDSHWNSMGK